MSFQSLAGWTFAFNDYHELNITRYMNNSMLDKLAEMVDPYCKLPSHWYQCITYFSPLAFLSRYSKTKIFQLQGAGDEFFLPDSEVILVFLFRSHFIFRRISFGMICKLLLVDLIFGNGFKKTLIESPPNDDIADLDVFLM